MFECPNCAHNLKFDIKAQQMKCDACESLFDPYVIEMDRYAENSEYFETNIFTCSQCGGQIISDDTEASTYCLFCGNPTIFADRISKEKCPDYIIPFKLTKEDCKKAYLKKVRKAFFVPKEYKKEEFIEGFKGVYMPYWSYHFSKDDKILLKGQISKRQGNYIISDEYDITGELNAEFNGDSYDAASSFSDDISTALTPYEMEGRKEFVPSFLSGFYGDCADVEQDLYKKKAEDYVEEVILEKLKQEEKLKKYTLPEFQNLSSQFDIQAERTLYPVWFMSYRIRDKISYVAVNGQTGKVVADLPMNAKKFLFSSCLLTFPIFILLNLFFVFNTVEVVVLGLVILFLSLLIYGSELRAIYEKENMTSVKSLNENDKREHKKVPGELFLSVLGFRFENGMGISPFLIILAFVCIIVAVDTKSNLWPIISYFTSYSVYSLWGQFKRFQKKNCYATIILSIAAILVSIIILLFKPVADYWYYGANILALVVATVNFMYTIIDYNKLAMRKLPHFDKNGGTKL